MKRYNLFLVIVLMATSWSLSAQDSLIVYQKQAGKSNPLILQRFYEYKAATEKVAQVGGLADPQLEIGYLLEPMEFMAGNQVADFKIMQMFPWFGVLKNGKDEMSWMAKAKYETFRDTKLAVYYEVQKGWYDLFKVREDYKIAQKNLELLKTLERIALVKFKSGTTGSSSVSKGSSAAAAKPAGGGAGGMGSMGGGNGAASPMGGGSGGDMSSAVVSSTLADVYQLQIEIGDLENNLALLQNSEKVEMRRFNALLNRAADESIFTPDSLDFIPIDASYLIFDDSMFVNNPMLKMVLNEQKSFIAKNQMQKNMGKPMVGLGLAYTIYSINPMSTSAMNGRDMIMPMVSLTLPLYRNKYKAMRSESEYQRKASIQNYQSVTNGLQTEYEEAIQLYYDAQRRVELYRKQTEITQKLVDIQIKSFAATGAGLSTVLRIQQKLIDYDTKKLIAIVEFNRAIALIKRLKSVSEIE